MWRLRTEIFSESIINPDRFENSHVIIEIIDLSKETGNSEELVVPNVRICDIYLIKENITMLEAFATLYSEVNYFIDRVSFVSYGIASLNKIISISPSNVKVGEVFEIAVLQPDRIRKVNPINVSDLSFDIEVKDVYQRMERLLRLGVNSISQEERYLNYYTLLEELAQLKAMIMSLVNVATAVMKNRQNLKKQEFLLKRY